MKSEPFTQKFGHAPFSAIADNWLRLDNHRIACEAVLLPAWRPGLTLASLALQPDIRTRLHSLRDGSGIDEDEHLRTLAVVSGLSGSLAEQAMHHMGQLTELAICRWQLERDAHEVLPRQLNWPNGPWLVQTLQDSLGQEVHTALFECVMRLLALDDSPQSHAKLSDAFSLVPESVWASLWKQPALALMQKNLLTASSEPPQTNPLARQPSAWARALAQASSDSATQKHQRLQRCVADNAWDTSLAWYLSYQLGWTKTPCPIEPSSGRSSAQPTAQWCQALHTAPSLHANGLNHLSKCVWLRQMPLLQSADWQTIDALAQHCQWVTHPEKGARLASHSIWLEASGQATHMQPQAGPKAWPYMTTHGLLHLFAPIDGEPHTRRQGEQPTMDETQQNTPAHATALVVDRLALQATVQAHTDLSAKWLSLVNRRSPANPVSLG